MKRIVVLQPLYLPWIGYFDQINKADDFVFFDDAQYSKQTWRNRNRIKLSNGQWGYLIVPVLRKNFFPSVIKDIKLNDKVNWRRKHLAALKYNYRGTLYFDEIFSLLEGVLYSEIEFLADLNISLILKIVDYLGIKGCQFLRSSKLNVCKNNKATEYLIELCGYLEASHYLTGDVAKGYLDENLFQKNNIVLEYHNYQHPTYKQLYGDFISHLSIVDLLFNEGKNSLNVINS